LRASRKSPHLRHLQATPAAGVTALLGVAVERTLLPRMTVLLIALGATACLNNPTCREASFDAAGIAGRSRRRRRAMLYTVAVILLILWLLGLVSGYTIGAFVHLLLVVALVLVLVQFISGRRVV
jgi:hypothetical protein